MYHKMGSLEIAIENLNDCCAIEKEARLVRWAEKQGYVYFCEKTFKWVIKEKQE